MRKFLELLITSQTYLFFSPAPVLAELDINKATEYSSYRRDGDSELVDRLLKRIAWEQVSVPDSDSESDEFGNHTNKTEPGTDSDEFYSAQESEEKEGDQNPTERTPEAHGSVIGELIDRYGLIPLQESRYWQENPNSLPYSQCILTDSKGNWEVGTQASLVYGRFFRQADGQTLFCMSDLEQTAFMIPVQSCNAYSCGLSITLAPFRKINTKFVKLRDLSPVDLFGTYSGLGGGFGMLTSLSGAILKHNNNAIEIHTNSFLSPGIIDVSLAYKKVEIQPRGLHDFEVYRLDYLHSLEGLKEVNESIENNQLIGDNFRQKILKRQSKKLLDLENLSHSKRFARISKYWIHNLNPAFTEGTYHSPLEQKLLTNLRFVKRKKL
ncbi:MAG: hypothetical protein HRU09_11940 [Oligoflexales bacterium]|nr:hypothetical protein [Oligoflexales bacterium]